MYAHITPDHAIALCPKVAHTSIKSALGNSSDSTEADRVTLFIRDPLQRFRSAIGWFTKSGNAWRYRKMVDAFLDGYYHDDPHYISQTQLHTVGGGFIPTEIVRFELLGEWWASNCQVELRHLHNVSAFRYPDYRTEEILAYYADDLELRA